MILHIFDTAEQIGSAVANLIVEQVNEKPNSVLGFATGASPIPTYKSLIKAYNKGKVSFKDIMTFNLDEYCDLPQSDKNSYYTFMHENLFNHIDVKEENVNFLNGNAQDSDKECERYDDLITANKIDIQLLGVGRNGHIGFNEPSNKFTKGTFKVRLTQSTIDANSVYFDEDTMPHYALTMGTVSIMKSKQIIMIATGRSKQDAIYEMVNGDITPSCPASVLQLHPDVHIFLDKAAAGRL